MSFMLREGWHCQFLEEDLKTSLPRPGKTEEIGFYLIFIPGSNFAYIAVTPTQKGKDDLVKAGQRQGL
jgi:hypothetical protein